METEEIIARLSEKLTDSDIIRSIHRNSEYSPRVEANDMICRFKRSNLTSWDLREALRIQHGVYKTSSVLDQVNQVVPVYAHISTEDKTLVAYTPDRQAGEADRQLRSSIGKLLQRAYPCLDEDSVRDLIETHQAEVNPNIVFVEGKAIAEVYMEEGGISSCMTPKEGQRQWTLETIPAIAYDAPGIKLATIRGSTGKLVSRCLVVEIGEEKRYIRNYGSPVLQKWLENNGYTPGGWVGVKFNTVKTEGDEHRYVMPYLDALGGMTKSEHCTVALVDGVITGVSARFRSYLANEGIPYGCPSSHGQITLDDGVSTESLKKKCPISGEEYLPYDALTVKVWLNAQTVEALLSSVSEGFVITRSGVMARPDDVVFIGGAYYLNIPAVLEDAGYVKLSAELYPDNQEWRGRYGVKHSVHGYILRENAIRYIKDDEISLIHKSKIEKSDVRLADFDGEKVYAAKGEPVYRTATKAKVHPKLHNIVKMHDGKWEYQRGKKSVQIFGRHMWLYSLSERVQVMSNTWRDCLDKTVAYHVSRDVPHTRAVLNAVRTAGMAESYVYNIKDTPLASLSSRQTYTSLSHSEINSASLSQILYVVENACHDRASGEKAYVVRWLKEMLAEMEAVEAPHYLAPYIEPTPEISIIQAVSETTEYLPEAVPASPPDTYTAVYPVNEIEAEF